MITLSKAAARRAIGRPMITNSKLEQRVLILDTEREVGPYTLEETRKTLETAVMGSRGTNRDAELELLIILVYS